MRAWLARPFPIWRGAWAETRFVLIVTAFVTGLVLVIRPFGLGSLPYSTAGPLIFQLGAACGLTAMVMRLAAPALVRRLWDESCWNVGLEILSTCLEVALVSIALMAVVFVHGLLAMAPSTALAFVAITGLCATVPATVRTLLVERWLRRRHQRIASGIAGPGAQAAPRRESRILEIDAQDGRLCLSESALRYIKAEENYVDVVWWADHARHHRLMRVTLAGVEARLKEFAVHRCHRSRIVSLAAVVDVVGNAQGYRLTLRSIRETIPVSRSRAPAFLAALAAWHRSLDG